MKRPGIDEYDAGSYLYGSLAVHDVLGGDDDGSIYADGSPSYDYEALNLAPDLCREHAFDLARTLGFHGPVSVRVKYQPGHPSEAEDVMVKDAQIASYAYGRAYFEPGEPRTAPCDMCGVETLVPTGGYE